MKKFTAVIAVFIAVLLAVLLLRALDRTSNESHKGKKNERSIPDRVSNQNGEVVVRLDARTLERNGIQVSELREVGHTQEFPATGLVLSAQELIELRNTIVSAKAQLVKAQAALEISRQDYERLSELYREDRNASAKALQAAEGTFHSDKASLKAAQDAMSLTVSNIQQRWGNTVSKWLIDNTPEFSRVLQQQDLLIQVTLPPDAEFVVPRTALLQLSPTESASARLISAMPRMDQKIQSLSYLYVTHNRRLLPGMALAVRLPAGQQLQGVIVPEDAVVWWQGRAWTYVERASDEFVRREVSTQVPTQNGWFVSSTSAIRPTDKIVVRGAQQLLSEEFRSEIQSGEEGGEDEK